MDNVAMKTIVIAAAALTAACASVGEAVEKTDLSGRAWNVPDGAYFDGRLLKITVPPGGGGAAMATTPIDLAPFEDAEVRVSVKARGRGIAEPKRHWNGAKLMLKYRDSGTGKFAYPQAEIPHGDFSGVYSVRCAFYDMKPTEAVLCLGLEDCSGEVGFDLSSLVVERRKGELVVNPEYKVKYPEDVARRAPLRGCMVAPGVTEQDISDLASWGAKLIRYQITPVSGSYYPKGSDEDGQIADFNRSLGVRSEHLRANVFPWARRHGLKVAVDMHMFPEKTIYTSKKSHDAFVSAWRFLAERLKGNGDVLYGYDLMNEPVTDVVGAPWNSLSLQEDCARAIREIDPEATIIVESRNYCGSSSYARMGALAMDNVIYSIHVYEPHAYTHQFVVPDKHPERAKATPLPENVERYLRDLVEPVRRYQKRHGCKIFVGEFSSVLWAERAEEYLAACIKIFNENGWDWTYHAFRESTLWSVEHEASSPVPHERRRRVGDTPRKLVLTRGFAE